MLQGRAAKAGLTDRIELHKCEEDAIGVDGEYDFVNAFWMVHEVPEVAAFVAEVHSLLKVGGHLLIAEPLFHVSKDDFAGMVALAEDTGLRECGRPRVCFSKSVAFVKS